MNTAVMEEDLIKTEAPSCAFQCSSDALLSIQLLEFKTSLLEVVEELRMNRGAKIQYEGQISKILLEKQELEWQNKTLSHQSETLTKEHKEAMAAFKKQLQAKMCVLEEEKEKFQLAAETKDNEITGLKEDLKTFQIAKYSLQKKLTETEQKLQLHILAKDDHLKQLSEVEKCYACIAHQFGLVKEVHERLEQNVQVVIQLNQKLTSVNKKREHEIDHLQQELKKLTTDLLKSKVACQQREGEENINLIEKEQKLQELQQKLQMETEINKMLSDENVHIKGEKQEIMRSLQHVQELLQRQTQAMVRVETQFSALKEDYQILERDNELQREKTKENEQKFLNLQNEHKKALGTWKKEEENFKAEIVMMKKELASVKESCIALHESRSKLSSPKAELAQQVVTLQNVLEPDQLNETESKQPENGCTAVTAGDVKTCREEETSEIQSMEKCTSECKEGQRERTHNIYKEHRTEIVAKDFQAFKDQVKETKQQQTKTPQSTALCVARLPEAEALLSECSDSAIPDLTKTPCLEKDTASAELKSQCSPCLLAKPPAEKGKVLVDDTEALGVGSADAGQQTDSSKHIFGTTTSKVINNINDKTDTAQNDIGVFINEPPNKEIPDNNKSEYNSSKINHTHGYKSSLQECSLTCLVTKLGKTEQVQKSNERAVLPPSESLPSKQAFTDQQEINGSDRMDECSNLNSASDSIKIAPFVTAKIDIAMEKDINTKTVQEISLPLNSSGQNNEESKTGANWKDVQSSPPEQGSAEEREHNATLPAPGISSILGKKTNIFISQDATSETVSTIRNKVSMDILLLSETGQSLKKDEQIARENALLNNIRESLSNALPERRGSEGWQEESYSTDMKPSGDLVNRRARSAFDLKTSGKKTEKTPVYLIFSDLSVFPRVNQDESQTMNTSTSKAPFLFDEKITYPVENKESFSNTLYQNPVINAVTKETMSDSPSIRRLADIWNSSSMHRDPRRDCSEEWNASAQTVSDSSCPTEHLSIEISEEEKSPCKAVARAHSAPHQELAPAEASSASDDSFKVEGDSQTPATHQADRLLDSQRMRQHRKRKAEESLESSLKAKQNL
ncbi:coiled-coil domain-containing protein 73 [Rhinatrema bivittatum]|uniref:coiled-coil domain-containing protein 73 n=1 Tax=Rhinatrema bivittatum TaxID=194408 RepID=UPI001127510F|nr:coiled-coil domain-containing protein 73 [Rhinatrema bivittatum]